MTLQAGISLAAARKLAADVLYEVAQGRDPSLAIKETKARAAVARADTIQAVCENFLKREGKKLRTFDQVQRALKRMVYPAIGDRLVTEIKRSEINKLLDHIEDTSGERSAEMALQWLRRVFNWFAIQSDSFRSPIIRGMSRYNKAEHRRDRVLDDDEIRQVWQATESGGAFCALVRFLLLTGARRSEAAGMTRTEITGNAWLLPAARNKTKADLVRPLSRAALAIVEAQPRIGDSPLIFTSSGRHPVHFGRGKREFDKLCAIPSWSLHDIRRTARTLLSRVAVDADTAERCLGHTLPAIRATYDKHKYFHEMEVAFELLSQQIEHIINPPAHVVVPIRR